MAFAPSLIINQYKDLSVEELEKKYEELKKNYCFETKEEQVKYIVDNLLDASHSVNTNSTKVGIEELLKEKTGKEYKIEPKTFEINLSDIINYVVGENKDPFWISTLSNYFQKLDNISENDKMQFLIELVQDKNSFNEFTKEIMNSQDAIGTYEKYKKIAEEYRDMNTMIG